VGRGQWRRTGAALPLSALECRGCGFRFATNNLALSGRLRVGRCSPVAARRKSPSKVDLQAVLRLVAAREWVESAELIPWIVETFACRERAAKDNVSVLVRRLAREGEGRARSPWFPPRHHREGAGRHGRELRASCAPAWTALLLNLPKRSEPSPAGGAAGTSRESARHDA
jgi:hypothetical protein